MAVQDLRGRAELNRFRGAFDYRSGGILRRNHIEESFMTDQLQVKARCGLIGRASRRAVVLGTAGALGFLTGCAGLDVEGMGQMLNGAASIYTTAQQGRALGAQAAAMRAQAGLTNSQAAAQRLANTVNARALSRP